MKYFKSFEDYSNYSSNKLKFPDKNFQMAFMEDMMDVYMNPESFYKFYFKGGLTREMMLEYIDLFIKVRGGNFLGDLFDREIFRDLLLFKFFNVPLSDIDSNIEPFLTDFEVDTNKYNL